MGFLVGLLTVVYFLTCVVLVIIVLMQEPKGGGLSSAFGGAGLDTAFGASIGRKMSTFTVWIAIFFVVLTIVLAILTRSASSAMSGSVMQEMGQGVTPAQQQEKKEQPAAPKQPGDARKGAETPKSAPAPVTPGKKEEPKGAKPPKAPDSEEQSKPAPEKGAQPPADGK